ncbi:CotH kinase family protein [Paenibacillus hodogayensis]|uniref:CotH kinase family protein n=1 Tax=Paenibacillus hodogayensis TaxID=279208 RepID=A0ABV5W7M3_9BACL
MNSKAALPILACLCIVMLLVGYTGKMFSLQSAGSVGTALASASTDTDKIEQIVFPKDKVVDVKITIDPNDFQDMLDNAAEEEMKTASVDYNGVRFDHIGIRTKGNLSLRSVVSSDSDRYSFKLSFDEYLTNQTFYGINKINLNNNYSDATYMREFLTYELAREMGLPVPEVSYVNVYVNDKLWGFYLAVEQIGDSYLERHFGNAYGALYKAEMGGNGGDLLWRDDKLSSYPALAQKSKSSNGDVLVDMLRELNNGSDYESVLDVEEALRYIALNVLAVNTDSYLGQNKQNYYLYEDEGIFSVLPWDYNMAFGGLGNAALMIDEPTQGALSERPLVAKLLQVDAYKEMYHGIIREAIEGYLAPDTFNATVQQIADRIAPYVEQDPRPFYSYEQFKSGTAQLVSSNTGNVQSYAGQLEGTIASSGDGSGSGGGMGGPGGGRGQGPGQQGQEQAQGQGQGQRREQVPGWGGPSQDKGNVTSSEAGAERPALVQTAAGAPASEGGEGLLPPSAPEGQQAPNGQQGMNDQPAANGRQGRGPFDAGGMGGPGGMGAPGGGGMGAMWNQGSAGPTSASYTSAYLTGALLVLLVLVSVFVSLYRRRRW